MKAKRRHDRPITYILKKLLSVRPDLQVVACSATIGRPLRRYLNGLLNVTSRELKHTTPHSLRVIRDETEGCDDVCVLSHKRAVQIPSCIRLVGWGFFTPHLMYHLAFIMQLKPFALINNRHCILPLAQPNEQLDVLVQTLASLRPSRPLVFLPDGERLMHAVLKLQNAGMRPLPVHEALGFISGQQLHISEAIIACNMLDGMFRKTKTAIPEQQNAVVSERRNEQEDDHPILIASQAAARGLHFEDIDYVFILGRPKNPDEYAHLAGRTGRLGRRGVVVNILSYREKKSLQSWATQLQITFEQLTEAVMEKGDALTT